MHAAGLWVVLSRHFVLGLPLLVRYATPLFHSSTTRSFLPWVVLAPSTKQALPESPRKSLRL